MALNEREKSGFLWVLLAAYLERVGEMRSHGWMEVDEAVLVELKVCSWMAEVEAEVGVGVEEEVEEEAEAKATL